MACAALREVDAGRVRGEFREVEFGNFFQYTKTADDEPTPFLGYKDKVWVTDRAQAIGGEQGFRWAIVMRTVAYLVVDEAADGAPVVQKWHIRAHKEYAHVH